MKTEPEEPMETIELDLDSLSKESLLTLIEYSHKKNLTFNEAIVTILTEHIKSNNL
jgi:hypothetical protein